MRSVARAGSDIVAFKAGACWWQIGEHFGMSQHTAYETVKRAKEKRSRK